MIQHGRSNWGLVALTVRISSVLDHPMSMLPKHRLVSKVYIDSPFGGNSKSNNRAVSDLLKWICSGKTEQIKTKSEIIKILVKHGSGDLVRRIFLKLWLM